MTQIRFLHNVFRGLDYPCEILVLLRVYRNLRGVARRRVHSIVVHSGGVCVFCGIRADQSRLCVHIGYKGFNISACRISENIGGIICAADKTSVEHLFDRYDLPGGERRRELISLDL